MRGLGVLGGEPLGREDLRAWVQITRPILAADHGFDHLVNAGLTPEVVVGDMDSIRSGIPDHTRHAPDHDQETSDCDKLLIEAERMGLTEVWLACAHGGRIDHLVGTFASALRSSLRVGWALPTESAILLRPGPEVIWSKLEGRRASLLPLMPTLAHADGLQWPIAGQAMALDGFISLSNRILGPLTVRLESGAALLLVERRNEEVLYL